MPKSEKQNPDVRSRGWCFTLNNWTPAQATAIEALSCRYLVYGREVGASGTPHLQGYIYFKDARTFRAVKKAFPKATHLECTQGTPQQASTYCKKEDQTPFEIGVLPKTPAQKGVEEQARWQLIKDLAKAGNLEEIEPKVFVNNYRTLKVIARDYMVPPPSRSVLVDEWHYGPTGTGKSQYGRRVMPGCYSKPLNKWWDSYSPGQEVLLEDVSPDHQFLGYYLKIWCDHYSFIGENKGSAIYIRPPKIIITSQYHPSDIWKDQETVAAILRRVKLVKHEKDPNYVEPEI